ncbi:phosphodiesterase [Cereibacter sphaeroides]|uniref:glycerophosphodiester phosphodiesterase family protein n=1 Tax=Cereibacter sphaeroides TaxID=1063 RepID=UPI001F18E9CC|nr:glycerophosphodiester phosphodiesterase family protein [Cereibacter sphaeroides]MCE6959932.1 phosphodiesterase [Cereibacter sphaeroides]MCE6973017.1 phosphodiesterase [Cereibacter sphaeroides]
MRVPLPEAFLRLPIAHRALHDRAGGRPENSPAAVRAAVEAGYGIEIDLQLSADGAAMVFHDEALDRLTGATGPVSARSAAELAGIRLRDSDEGIPTLGRILGIVDGRVPLVIEIKDQDGALGPTVGPLEAATARALEGYAGPVAVMSFNPHSIAEMARLAPHLPRGLVTCSYNPQDWAPTPAETCERLRAIPDFDRVGASFISHEAADLSRPRVAELKAAGAAILCWTIRSPTDEAKARRIADNVTFEGYLSPLPA